MKQLRFSVVWCLVLVCLFSTSLYAQVPARVPLRPRVALVPLAAPPGYEELARRLNRAMREGVSGQAEGVEVSSGLPGRPVSSCLEQPECIDTLLGDAGADAALLGELLIGGSLEVPEVDLLLSIVAPLSQLGYVERYTEPSPEGVKAATASMLEQVLSQWVRASEPIAASPARESGSSLGEVAPPATDELALEQLERQKRLRNLGSERAAAKEEKLEARRKAKEERLAKHPRVGWADGREDASGWSIDVGGGVAGGGMSFEAVSQITGATDQYRWADTVKAQVPHGRFSAHYGLTRWLEIGLTLWGTPWQGRAYLYHAPQGGPVEAETYPAELPLQAIGVAELRIAPSSSGRWQPVFGLGGGGWFLPGITDLQERTGAPHQDFGPYIRPTLYGDFELRYLLSRRWYLDFGTAILAAMDEGEVVPVEGVDTAIPISAQVPGGYTFDGLQLDIVGTAGVFTLGIGMRF